ncbi:MAG TPA: ISL3 family transposase [Candidatus Binatia bacterium]|nr:ISL3 family transposase [Candidatus Binatia bacterium]
MMCTTQAITLVVTTTHPSAACPSCHCSSTRVHSRYRRTLADLPWSGVAVWIVLVTRRFACRNPACRQRLFGERLPTVVGHYARRTARLYAALQRMGFALGGQAGARLARHLSMPVSGATLLRYIRQAALPSQSTPRVLGVDEWAYRKGQRYGTILVDLEQHRPVELLPDREAQTLAGWLQGHPGVTVVSRDRAGGYAEGARQGAPGARQVADRWHLLKNLTEAVERFLSRHHPVLQQAAARVTTRPAQVTPPSEAAVSSPLRGPPTRAALAREQCRARYEEVRALHQQGATIRSLAQRFRMHRCTVRRFLRAEGFPERAQPPRWSSLTRFLPYLEQRWNAGCHNAAALWREVRGLGFRGTASLVRRVVGPWRAGLLPAAPSPFVTPSPRATTWRLLGPLVRKRGAPTPEQQAFVTALSQLCPEVARVQALALDFARLLRQRRGVALEGWLAAARQSAVPELVSFVRGVQRDQLAVTAAFTEAWSNGQVEGQVNRLKLLKRQMYGRAKLDLLRARVLRAA